MSGHQLAEGLASLGRGKDTMLMHVTPREVEGLQNLAMAQGGSLTINPQTGLPEAGFFDDAFGIVAPIGLGMLLGPAGLGMSALGAGLATGVAGFALSGGDLGAGISAGLGGYGGSGLGESFKAFATPEIAKTAGVDAVTRAGITNASTIPGTIGSDMLTSGVGETLAGTVPYSGVAGGVGQMGAAIPMTAATDVSREILASQIPAQTAMQQVGSGAMNAIKNPSGFFGSSGPGTMGNALTLASPLMAIQPETPGIPEDTSYKMKYEGPYTAQDRNPRLPSQEEMTQLAAQGSPEYSYFGNSNPYPGFNKAPGYAQGGVANLFGTPDGTAAQNTLAEPYGLGRLNNLATAAATENAKEYGFDAGGTIPYMPGAPAYGVAPTDLSAVAAIPTTPGQQAPNVNQQLNNATTDPFGRTTQSGTIYDNQGFSPYDPNRTQGGMGGKGGQQNNNQGGMGGKGGQNNIGSFIGNKQGKAPKTLTMQDYITAATRTYNPSASMAAAMDPTGAERAHFTNINPQPATLKAAGGGLKDGGFVVPADVVSHLGNGSTDAGLAALQKRHGAQPIRGAGDGMSDSIKTTINGRQPARVADGEAYIPPEQVKRSGGANKFYAMMDKVRKERTGTKKQGKQINPNKFMTA